jgi:hypothetical protein
MWLAIVGYGVAFAGMSKLGGGNCSIVDAFRNKCGPGALKTSASATQPGTTLLASSQAAKSRQIEAIGTQPIGQAV